MLCGVPVLGPVSGQPPSSEAKKPERPPWMPNSQVHPLWFFIGQTFCWLVVLEHVLFFHILGIIISADFHIFQCWNHQPVCFFDHALIKAWIEYFGHEPSVAWHEQKQQPCLVPQMCTHWATCTRVTLQGKPEAPEGTGRCEERWNKARHDGT